jgi:hypothetical protein
MCRHGESGLVLRDSGRLTAVISIALCPPRTTSSIFSERGRTPKEGGSEKIVPARTTSDRLSVDSGFIYGFERVPTSQQFDVIVWHRAARSPIYDAGTIVIVPPESVVVAVISVKSRMTRREVKSDMRIYSVSLSLTRHFEAILCCDGQGSRFRPSRSSFFSTRSQIPWKTS